MEYGAQFARSLVLTRMLGPTEFGIASSMAILVTVIDMSTAVGAGRYLVQAKDGASSKALASAHALTLIRCALNACLLLALAWPTAELLGVPGAVGAFLWLPLVPLLRGFEHLRPEQVQREHQFRPAAVVSVVANISGLATVACAAFVLRDHEAVLWGLAGQAVALVLASRVVARTPYRVSFASDSMRGALRFGIPLMANGLALAALSQFDRLAVGSLLGVEALGRYSLATMIFYLPTSLLFRVIISIAQPRLSAVWHRSPSEAFPKLFQQLNISIAATAAVAAVCVSSLGDAVLTTAFGPGFAVGDVFFAVYSLAVFMRFAKISANMGGLAIGRTKDLMLSNLPAALGLGVTVGGVLAAPHLSLAALGLLAGEALGAGTAFARLDRYLRGARAHAYSAFAITLPIPCAAAAWVLLAQPSVVLRMEVCAALCLCVASGLALRLLRGDARADG